MIFYFTSLFDEYNSFMDDTTTFFGNKIRLSFNEWMTFYQVKPRSWEISRNKCHLNIYNHDRNTWTTYYNNFKTVFDYNKFQKFIKNKTKREENLSNLGINAAFLKDMNVIVQEERKRLKGKLPKQLKTLSKLLKG